MAQIIDGKLLAEKIKNEVVNEIVKLSKDKTDGFNRRPNLAIILIGDRDDSRLYVDLKEKEAKKIGIDTHIYRCADNTPEQEIFEMIGYLNKDEQIDAILVQLPLPAGFDTDGIIHAIKPAKDVDRFHPNNLEKLFKTCNHADIMPPVAAVVTYILNNIDFKLENKDVCLVVNSEIFGASLKKVLECKGAKVRITNAKNKNLEKDCQADLLISAVGQPGLIKKEMVKKGAVVIDIGIAKESGKIYGDVDFDDVEEQAGFITPVPGGVGPMTIAMLFKNTLALYRQNRQLNDKVN